jgi:hypothetical protein
MVLLGAMLCAKAAPERAMVRAVVRNILDMKNSGQGGKPLLYRHKHRRRLMPFEHYFYAWTWRARWRKTLP